jgi:hypothetical protein
MQKRMQMQMPMCQKPERDDVLWYAAGTKGAARIRAALLL